MLLKSSNEEFALLMWAISNVNILSGYICILNLSLLTFFNVLFLTGFTEVDKISREISSQTP